LCIQNFDEIFQHTAEVKLLPVSENGRQTYWNCTSGFDFDLCVVTGMSCCIHLPNFVAIRRLAAELWRHSDFLRWQPKHRKSTFGFRFCNGTRLRRWISFCVPNFDEIPQSTCKIKLLPVLEKARSHIGIVLPVSTLTYLKLLASHFASVCQISS